MYLVWGNPHTFVYLCGSWLCMLAPMDANDSDMICVLYKKSKQNNPNAKWMLFFLSTSHVWIYHIHAYLHKQFLMKQSNHMCLRFSCPRYIGEHGKGPERQHQNKFDKEIKFK